jgi:Nif-specific regulatory protein
MSNTSVATGRDHTNEIRRLSTLLEVSQALSGVLNLKAALQSVLDLLERRHQVVGGTVFLQDPESRELHAEASTGPRITQRGRARAGEGITERVIDTGRPVVVPRVSQEPSFVPAAGDRLRNGREYTYLAVPITVGRRPGGTFEVVLPFKSDRDYQRSLEFYRVVASMVAQALKLRRTVEADRSRLAEENEHLRGELQDKYAFRSIIGNSASIQQVYEQVAQVARTNTTVLIRGESGTGKEMIAHAIHYNSPRAKKPFIKVSCAALPESLIESELFGYEKGAFTGAQSAKKGRFELAEGARSSSTRSATSARRRR